MWDAILHIMLLLHCFLYLFTSARCKSLVKYNYTLDKVYDLGSSDRSVINIFISDINVAHSYNLSKINFTTRHAKHLGLHYGQTCLAVF